MEPRVWSESISKGRSVVSSLSLVKNVPTNVLLMVVALSSISCGASQQKVPLQSGDASAPSLTLCVNVQDPDREELCDGTSVNAAGQNIDLDGPGDGDSITVVAAAEDAGSGVQEVVIYTETHSVRCATDDPDTGIDTSATIVATVDADDSGPKAEGDEVPEARSVARTYDVDCGGQDLIGYEFSFRASAKNYVGIEVLSQLITVRPG
jgi:microcompartment protein CcmK/EutM